MCMHRYDAHEIKLILDTYPQEAQWFNSIRPSSVVNYADHKKQNAFNAQIMPFIIVFGMTHVLNMYTLYILVSAERR